MSNRFFASPHTSVNRNQQLSLAVESLEDRMMLSSVQIFAAGATGTESLDLRINDVVVSTFEHVGGDVDGRQFQQLNFDTPQNITAGEIRLEFTNDLYRPEDGFDRNIVIDRIVVDGQTFETESPSTFSTGVFKDGGVTDPGFLETETLNINGSFFYSNDGVSDPAGTTLRIEARGDTGEEQLQVRVDGDVVQTFHVTTTTDSYFVVFDEDISVDQVQVEFTNDLFKPDAGIDRNLIVKQIQLTDRQTHETETFVTDSDSTFSTGTYLASDGIVDGFGRGNTLHGNGFFRYAQSDNSIDSLVLDESFGNSGFVLYSDFRLSSFPTDSAISPSGKIASLGNSLPFDPGGTSDLFLLDGNGTLINQTAVGSSGRFQATSRSVEFGPDESIYLGLSNTRSAFNFETIKLTPEGNLDTSFGSDGILRTLSVDGISSPLVVASDGSLFSGGFNDSQPFEVPSISVVKRDAQGNLDETFGGDGRVELDFANIGFKIAATSDGGVFVVGTDSQTSSRTVTKFSADGTPVSSYGFNGSTSLGPLDNPFGTSVETQLVVDSQGRLILTTRVSSDRTEIKRLDSDGQIDTSFGDGGTVTLSPDFEVGGLDSSDRIVGFANVQDNATLTASIFRLDENGNLDASFADDGFLETTADVQGSSFSPRIESIKVGDDNSIFANSGSGLRKYISA